MITRIIFVPLYTTLVDIDLRFSWFYIISCFFCSVSFASNGETTHELKNIVALHHELLENEDLSNQSYDSICELGITLSENVKQDEKWGFYYYDFALRFIANKPYSFQNKDSLITVLQQNITELHQFNSLKTDSLLAEYKLELSLFYTNTNKPNQAINLLLDLHDNRSLTNQQQLCAVSNLGAIYLRQEVLDSALIFCDKAYDLACDLKDTGEITFAINSKANTLFLKKDFVKSYLAYQQGIALCKASDCPGMGVLYQNLVDIFLAIKDYDQAILYAQKSIQASGTSSYIKLNGYEQLAEAFKEKNKWDSAYKYTQLWHTIAVHNGFEQKVAHTQLNLGRYYIHKKQYDSALKQISLAKNYFVLENTKKSNYHMAICSYYNAKCYMHLDKVAKAQQELDKAMAFNFREIENINALIAHNKVLNLASQLAYKTNNFKSSALYLNQANALQDSINKQIPAQAILKVAFQQQLKNHQLLDSIQLAKKETEYQYNLAVEKKQRNQLLYVAILIVLLLIIIVWFVLKIKSEKQKNELLILQNKLNQTQIEPHFVANTLSIIQNKIVQGSQLEASNMISDFSKMNRLMLEQSRESFVLLKDELQLIKTYVAFQQSRDDNFKFTLDVDERINASTLAIPSLLTQPLIENAIQHGFSSLNEQQKGKLLLQYKLVENGIAIHVSDNGKGMDKAALEKIKSYTYKMVSERIAIFNALYAHKKFTLSVTSEVNKGTEVYITLPYENKLT